MTPPNRPASSRVPFWKRAIAVVLVTLAVAVCAVVLARQAAHRRVQGHIDAGIAFARDRRAGEAEREWLAAAKREPNNATVWQLLSELYLGTEQWQKALDALQHLLRVAPQDPLVYSKLAGCALRTGDELQAQSYAETQLKRALNDEASLTILAFLSEMQDDADRQIGYLERLIRLHPDDIENLQSLVSAYQQKSRFADMRPTLDRLLTLRPDDPFALTMRAASRAETDSSPDGLQQSETDLKAALARAPAYPFARYYMGRVFMRQGQYLKAIQQLEIALRMSPHNMNVPFELATAYARVGEKTRAAQARDLFETLRREATQVSVLQKRCSLNPKDFAAHLEMGQLTLARGDLRQAGYYLQRATQLRPDSAEAQSAYRQMTALIQARSDSPREP